MLLRNITATMAAILLISTGYFLALGIFWLWVMSLFASGGFIMLALGCHWEGI